MVDKPIILFDGVCNFCNSSINFIIRNDKRAKLNFAPMQSNIGERLRREYKVPVEVDSVFLIENGKVYTYSTAALKIAKYLDWPSRVLAAFIIVPKFIRDPVYKWIARNRYKWFGKKDQCMIPTVDVRSRFLD